MTYLLASLMWSLFGFAVGYTIGVTQRKKWNEPMTENRKSRRIQVRQGQALLLLAVFTVASSFYSSTQDGDQRDCVAEKFTELTSALAVRTEIAERNDEITARVIEAVAQAKTDAQVRRALSAYLIERASVRRYQGENPIPPFPDGACK